MKFLLKHHFDPDFDHLNRKPRVRSNEPVDHLNRDYVQNVVTGQLLAELEEATDLATQNFDTRHILDQPVFPMGPNTATDPQNPKLLRAAADGYVIYDSDGKISVKTLLNVSRDVDYATGNISFVGDVVIHGSVRSGFKVKARNILVNGPVEAATLVASQAIQVQAGVKGDNRALLKAARSIKVKFCENATLSAGKNLLVEGSCLHCKLFVGNALAVRNKLIGGEAICRRVVHIGAQLGGGMNTITTLTLGYDPFLMQKITELENTIKTLKSRRNSLNVAQDHNLDPHQTEAMLISELDHKLSVLEKQRLAWTEQLASGDLTSCAVIVPGEIRPGVDVSIGQAFLAISDYVYNVRLALGEEQIEMTSPAEPKR